MIIVNRGWSLCVVCISVEWWSMSVVHISLSLSVCRYGLIEVDHMGCYSECLQKVRKEENRKKFLKKKAGIFVVRRFIVG